MNRTLRGFLPVGMLLLAACAPKTPLQLAPLPDRPWTVLPGDEVRIRVYREPDLSGQWIVNGKGEVIVPGLGRIMASGLTADSLAAVITGGYSRRIVDAIVDVGIVRLIPVLGQVKSPGIYAAEPTMSVQQLVAKSGGIRGTSLRMPTLMLQKGSDGRRYALAADIRLDRVALDEGDAVLVEDPSLIERWAPWVDTMNRFGSVITIVMSILIFTKR